MSARLWQIANCFINTTEVVDTIGDVGMICAESFFVNGKGAFVSGAGGGQVAHDSIHIAEVVDGRGNVGMICSKHFLENGKGAFVSARAAAGRPSHDIPSRDC